MSTMRNRWFHPPKLHSPSPGNARRVGWLELFYDLIYVAAIVQLGNGLAHHVGLIGFLAFAGLFVPIWSTWTSFTFYSNRFVVDDFVHRAVVFAQMFGVAAMAVSVPEVFEGRPVPFAISYAFVRLTIVGLYLRTYLQTPEGRRMTRRNLLGFGGSALLWLAAIFVAAPWVYLLWGVALVIDFGVPLNRQSRAVTMEFPPDAMHISERYGLLTIIVLGESFVKVLSEVAASGLTPTLGAMGALALLVTFSLWWIYFDDVAGSRIKRGTLTPFVWVYAHLPLTLGVTAVGVAVKKAALMAPLDPGAGKSRWLLCGSLALTLFAVGVLDAVTERRHANVSDRPRFLVRLSSAVLVLLLAPTGRFMPAWAFVAIIALVCVAQVVLDLFLAPMTDPDEAHHEHQQLFADRRRPAPEPAADPATGSSDPARPPRLRNPLNFVRRGAPSELRADLYFQLMEGSWTQLMVLVLGFYLFLNVLFAALYLLDPSGIAGAKEASFGDAFYFSVQTLFTIGYGVLSPASTYANVLVSVEALCGALVMAVTTGLVFAKAARPRSSVLFSAVAVIQRYDGKRMLMFRLGNARGNEVVEASLRVTVLREETTAEGQSMRRLYDVKLVRERSPLFVLSWLAMHEIDEESPLFGLTSENLYQKVAMLTVTMVGYDATYGQTTHARHLYHPDDIRCGHRFVDVLSRTPEGQSVIDFRLFHDTVPQPEAAE